MVRLVLGIPMLALCGWCAPAQAVPMLSAGAAPSDPVSGVHADAAARLLVLNAAFDVMALIGATLLLLLAFKVVRNSKRASAKLATLAHVAAKTDNAVIITDPSGRIEWVNPGFTRMTEYSLGEVRGRKPGDFLQGPETDPAVVAHMADSVRRQSGFLVEVVNYTRSGRPFHLRIDCQPVRDDTGRLTHFIAVELDITEAKQREAQLKAYATDLARARAELELRTIELEARNEELLLAKEAADSASRLKSQFLANMSHELRTPLTSVLGFADLLAEAGEDPTIARAEALDAIRRNASHLLALVNDTLDLSKIEAGELRPESIPFDPAALVEEVARALAPSARAKGLAFEWTIDPALPRRALGDPLRIRQILTNLAHNAIKFTPAGSVRIEASLRAELSGDRLVVAVHDTGVGIDPSVIASLFDPFSQADSSTTRRFGGTGLGLSIAGRLADLLGGRIEVHSTPGEGSTFSADLPIPACPRESAPAAGEPAPRAPAQAAPREGLPLEGLRILLAEDGVDNQRLLGMLLRRAGAAVDVVPDGLQAVNRAMATSHGSRRLGDPDRPYDLILMDVQMPEMDGIEATRRLRARGYGGAIIALTAHAMAGDRERCLAAGCDEYLSKPVQASMLVRTCRRWTGRPTDSAEAPAAAPANGGAGVEAVAPRDGGTRPVVGAGESAKGG